MRVVITRLSIAGLLLCASRASAYEAPAVCSAAELTCEPEAPSPVLRAEACLPGETALEFMLPGTPAAEVSTARASFERATALYRSGSLDDALLHLRVVERAMPRIADRVALRRAQLLEQLGMPSQACQAYAVAKQSPDRGTATRAEIGTVRCLLASFDKAGEAALQALTRRYPNLGERHALRLLLARVRERSGQLGAAAALLRSIDLEAPASQEAVEARVALEQLGTRGVRPKPLSGLELADRAERLWRQADVETAAAEVDRVLAQPKLSAEASGRLHMLAARIARQQGHWERATSEAQRALRAGAADAQQLISPQSPVAEQHETDETRARIEKQARALHKGKPLPKLGNSQLRALFELAVDHDMQPLLDEVIVAIAGKTSIVPAMRFEIAMRASGVADDAALATLLESLLDVPSLRLPARYHLARAYERCERRAEAEAAYARVISDDRGSTPYYAMWADQRLRAMHGRPAGAQGGEAPTVAAPKHAGDARREEASFDAGVLPARLVGFALQPPSARAKERSATDDTLDDQQDFDVLDVLVGEDVAKSQPAPSVEPDLDDSARLERVRELLTPLIAEHGEAYPWLQRALDLAEIGAFDEAADEMSEAYLAWRDAIGAPRLRSGLFALLTGDAPPRRAATGPVRNARRALHAEARGALSAAVKLLGDPGIGLRLGSVHPDSRPRAYAQLVEAAARKHGIDPNLLFAVMRVESIYNRRIVSTAGAIGLMQIMPGTGRRIAQRMGVDGFTVSDLLDPKLNVEFSAWYLASLLERFDGRLPLAIASYNGGPHNVRLWMRRSSPSMPLDAFLEQIPFSQTHRYVRRVLTHYAAYRAQQKLPMTTLSLSLPSPKPDDMAF